MNTYRRPGSDHRNIPSKIPSSGPKTLVQDDYGQPLQRSDRSDIGDQGVDADGSVDEGED